MVTNWHCVQHHVISITRKPVITMIFIEDTHFGCIAHPPLFSCNCVYMYMYMYMTMKNGAG